MVNLAIAGLTLKRSPGELSTAGVDIVGVAALAALAAVGIAIVLLEAAVHLL